MRFIDRQFLVAPEPPTTLGRISQATDENFNCLVEFRGRIFEARSAGKNALQVGDLVSFIELDRTDVWVVKSPAGYPTRYRYPLATWARNFPANLLLQSCMRNNPRYFTYRLARVDSIVDANTLRVSCWDGQSRDLPVEYAGTAKAASAFSINDAVVCYQKYQENWVVIGKENTAHLTVSPTSKDFGLVNCYEPLAYLFWVSKSGGSGEPIIITVSAPFELAFGSVGYPWSDSLVFATDFFLGPYGFFVRFNPTDSGSFAQNMTISSVGADSLTVPLTGIGNGLATGSWTYPNATNIPQTENYTHVHPGDGTSHSYMLASSYTTVVSATGTGKNIRVKIRILQLGVEITSTYVDLPPGATTPYNISISATVSGSTTFSLSFLPYGG